MLKYLTVSAVIIVLDQVTKWLMVSWLALYETVAVMPYFNLTMAHNYGAAFSFLAQAGGWQRWFFIVLAIVISIVLIVWLAKLKPHAKLEAISLSLILGGAIGNVIDRIVYGYVVDFLDVYIGSSHWPAFNVADSAICIGAVLLILDSFKSEPESQTS
jgi:signal peptidase II